MDEIAERNRLMVQAWRDGQPVTQIAQQFGLSLSWTGQVLRNAGAALPDSGRGIKCELDVGEVVAQYEAGLTVRALADQRDVSYGKIYRLLQAANVEMRPRGGHTR